jgi:carboxymethylenebutenolidase
MIEQTRSVTTPDGDMSVVVTRPDGAGPFPVVVLFHHGPGLDDGTRRAMARFTDEGYLVAAPDRYHRHGDLIVADVARFRAEPDSDGAKRFGEMVMSVTDEMVAEDLAAVIDDLAADPAARDGRYGVVGYCIGARAVLRAMAAHPDLFTAGAAFHPSFCVTPGDDSPHHVVAGLQGALYVGIGSEDRMQSAEANQPLIDAVDGLGERGTAEVLEGANHGFAVPGPAYHEGAAARAYGRTLAMFDREVG